MHAKALSLALVVLTVSSLFIMMPMDASAQALPFKIQLDEPIVEVHYQQSTQTLWAIASNGTEGIGWLYAIDDPDTVNYTYDKYTLSPTDLHGGVPYDIWCGLTECYVTSRDTSSDPSAGSIIQIASLDTPSSNVTRGQTLDTLFDTSSEHSYGKLDGRDSSSQGIGGVSLYVESYETISSALRTKIIQVGATGGNIAVSNDLQGGAHVCGGTGASTTINCFIRDIEWTGIAGTNNNYLAVLFTNLAGTNAMGFSLRNLANDSVVCSDTQVGTAEDQPSHIFMDRENFFIYYGRESGDWERMGDSATAFNCNANTQIDNTITGLSVSQPKNGGIFTTRDLAIFQESGANARMSISAWNEDTGEISPSELVIETFPINTQSAQGGKMFIPYIIDENGQKIFESADLVFIPQGADETIFVYRFSQSQLGAVDEICFTVQATGQSICYPTDENGNPIVNSLIEPAGSQLPIYSVVGGYVCQIGFFSECTAGYPTNTNLETNGIGYLMWFMTWAIMTAVMGVAFFGTIKKTPLIGIIPMIVVLFISVALAVILNWVPERDFYIVVFIVIGFASLASANFMLGKIGRGGGGE